VLHAMRPTWLWAMAGVLVPKRSASTKVFSATPKTRSRLLRGNGPLGEGLRGAGGHHADNVRCSLERDIFVSLGHHAIKKITLGAQASVLQSMRCELLLAASMMRTV